MKNFFSLRNPAFRHHNHKRLPLGHIHVQSSILLQNVLFSIYTVPSRKPQELFHCCDMVEPIYGYRLLPHTHFLGMYIYHNSGAREVTLVSKE